MIGQRNPAEMHYKWIQIAMEHDSVTLSPWVCPCVYSHILYSFSLFINTCFITFYLCGNSFLQSWRTRALFIHWPLVQWLGSSALTTVTQLQSPVWNSSLAPHCCRPRSLETKTRSNMKSWHCVSQIPNRVGNGTFSPRMVASEYTHMGNSDPLKTCWLRVTFYLFFQKTNK